LNQRGGLPVGMAFLCIAFAGCSSVSEAPFQVSSQCRVNEQVVFACNLQTGAVGVCLGEDSLHYRFGPIGEPKIDIASDRDWSNIHSGGNRSQAGLNQDYIRFTKGQSHYVVHSGETGPLNENPGRRISGVVTFTGKSANVASVTEDCQSPKGFDFDSLIAVRARVDDDYGGPFAVIY
jgi:hypothetical protein